MRCLLASAVALALSGFTGVSFANSQPDTNNLVTTQLPRSVQPMHYDVTVTPHASALNFDANAVISIHVVEETSSITLNALEMQFRNVQLVADNSSMTFATPEVTIDAAKQLATFTFAKKVPVGMYRLKMDYTGKINTQANGFFAIDYDTKAGKKRALYTQFENSDARQFVPSWDEPNYKATFKLTAVVPTAEMAVSNMPIVKTEKLGKGLSRVSFDISPKMSTYLLFFGLGDFERASVKEGDVELGVVTQRGALPQAAFALESSKSILHEFNDYFGVPYPLPKLDNIASPGSSQFFSAMENWGAIYTFEYALLMDPNISTQSDKQNIFTTQAHEMAHQWFGDLVTMNWWDDLWLNEGFASWMESRTTEKLHPEWNTHLSGISSREYAMGRDAVATTHPVVQHVATVEQANQAFDAITYSKGQAVIHMLEGYVGEEAWREGVRRYMKKHAYGNTRTDDFWQQIEAAAGKPILDIAHDFTLKPGVPMIIVTQAVCKDGNTRVQLSQGEFSKDQPNKVPLSWRVPVILKTIGNDQTVSTLVANGKADITVPGCGALLVNAGQSGYYRTQYSPQLFASLKNDFAKLSPIDQLGLMGNTSALGLVGQQSASDVLDLAKATSIDADPQVWQAIARRLSSWDYFYEKKSPQQMQYRKFAIATLTPIFNQTGWTAKQGESEPVVNLRSELINVLSQLGDPQIIQEARRRYATQVSDPNAVPVELRRLILSIVARYADASTWDKLHADAIAEKAPLVKDTMYTMLSIVEDEKLAQRALDLALTDEPGETMSASMIDGVAFNYPEMAFDFAMTHREAVDKKVDATSRSTYYPQLGNGSLNESMIEKIKTYAEKYVAVESRRDAETVIANIKYRLQIRDKQIPLIDAWIKDNQQ
jgi:aminopeptidase N